MSWRIKLPQPMAADNYAVCNDWQANYLHNASASLLGDKTVTNQRTFFMQSNTPHDNDSFL
jgi:hypothetical protein